MEYIKIKNILEFKKKSKIKASEGLKVGKYNFYTSSKDENKFLNYFEYSNEAIIIGTGGNANIHHSYGQFSVSTDCFVLENKDDKKFLIEYVYRYLLKNIHILENGFRGAGLKHISKEYLENIEIPVISLEKQKQLIKILKNIDTFIDENKQIKNELNFLNKSLFSRMFGEPLVDDRREWKFSKIKNIGKIISGSTPSTNISEYWGGEHLWITPAELNNSSFIISSTERKLTDLGVKSSSLIELPIGTVLLSSRAPIGKVAIVGKSMYCNQGFKNIIPNEEINSIYLYHMLKEKKEYLNFLGRGATFKELSKEIIENISIKVPPIELQNKFSERVEKIEKLSFIILSYIFKISEMMKKKGVENN